MGCDILHDDLSKCNVYLYFKYDYNLKGENWFATQVEEVRVFAFNEDGFVQSFTENGEALGAQGYRMAIPNTLRNCTMVVWAGRTAEHYTIPTLAVGDPIEKLTLAFLPQNNTSNKHIASLWHSGPVEMTFPDNGGTSQTISLVRNTNDITISLLSSIDTKLNPADYEITLTGANGSYDYRNGFLTENSQIAYIPAEYGDTEAKLYTLRVVKGSPLMLSIIDKASGRAILANDMPQIDIAEFLLKTKPDGMDEQEYLDKRYLWDVQLKYNAESFIAISLTINDWTHWFQKIEL